MPRIIAGEFGGRALSYPSGDRFRPTTGKVREALFSIIGDGILDARVLDLYAAAGALGLEALSRGAHQAVFVEHNPEALRCLERNVKAFGVGDRVLVVKQDVRIYLRQAKFFATHIFCDPPYHATLSSETLELLACKPGLEADTLIVLEHPANMTISIPDGLELDYLKQYGDTALSFIHKCNSRRNE